MMLKKTNIPNYISVFRLCLIPLFVYFYFVKRSIVAAVVTFLVAGASDVLDGYLARKHNWTSNLGRILDPVADKSMQATVLICLSVDKVIPWWISGILIGKELLLVLGATRLIKKFNKYVQSGWYGKSAVVIFYAVVIVLMLNPGLNSLARTLLACLIIAVMLFALVMYYFKMYRGTSKNGKL